MATATEAIDIRDSLTSWLGALTAMTSADVKAIPADKWTVSMGGCARAANELLADTIANLRWTTAALKGESSDAYANGFGGLAAELTNQDEAVAALRQAAAEFSQALKAASDEILNSTVTAPWGMPTPVAMLANVAV